MHDPISTATLCVCSERFVSFGIEFLLSLFQPPPAILKGRTARRTVLSIDGDKTLRGEELWRWRSTTELRTRRWVELEDIPEPAVGWRGNSHRMFDKYKKTRGYFSIPKPHQHFTVQWRVEKHFGKRKSRLMKEAAGCSVYEDRSESPSSLQRLSFSTVSSRMEAETGSSVCGLWILTAHTFLFGRQVVGCLINRGFGGGWSGLVMEGRSQRPSQIVNSGAEQS